MPKARGPLCAPETGNDAELDFGEAHLGRFIGKADMASQRDLGSPSQRVTVYRGDEGLVPVCDQVQGSCPGFSQSFPAFCVFRLREFGDIGPGDKGLPSPVKTTTRTASSASAFSTA